MIEYSAGIVTAYGSAVRAGYTGTYEDFCRQQAQYAENAQAVEQAKQDAITAKNTAISAKDDAVTAKNTAVSAKDDAVSAKNTAVSAKDDAVLAKNTATTKAQEAGQSATSAGQSATSASQSAQNAEQSAQDISENLEQIQTNKEDVDQLKAGFNDLVIKSDIGVEFGAFKSGFMQKTGVVATNAQAQYASVNITSDLVGKTLYVSGTSWYDIKPYVFVGTSIVCPDVDTGSTLTQYTDLEFTPSETGTLYVNKFDSGNTHHIGKAFYEDITSIKPALLPKPLPITDIVNYETVSLTTISNRLLNGSTGIITTSDQASYVVTDYTEVVPNTKAMITTQHFYGQGLYAFYDSAKNFISGASSESGGTPTKIYCRIVDVPETAKYVVIGLLYQSTLFPACYLWQGIEQSVLPSKKWNGLKWSCIGDSLTDYNKRTLMHYFDYIAGATGIEIHNMGKSGSGYYKTGDDGSANFMDRVANVPTDSDVVTIFGSGNDLSTGLPIGTASDSGTETLGGVINTTIDNLYEVLPVVNLGIVTPTPWINQMPLDNGTMEAYANLIVEICRRRSIPCLDLYHCSNLNPNSSAVRQIAYSKDDGNGVHPDETGHKLIAPRFKAFLETLLM